MSSNNSSSAGGGIGFAGLLTIVFIILKLVPSGQPGHHIIDWSWWWVLAPLWISWALAILIIAIVAAVIIIKEK